MIFKPNFCFFFLLEFSKTDRELMAENREDLLLAPETFDTSHLSPTQLDNYLDLVCKSSLIYGASNNLELGLHVLNYFRGDVKQAVHSLLDETIGLPDGHPITTYKYNETVIWTSEEIKRFEAAILRHDKQFADVAVELETKSTSQCVEFYYLWKKIMNESTKKKWRAVKRNRNNNTNINNMEENAEKTTAAKETELGEDSKSNNNNNNNTNIDNLDDGQNQEEQQNKQKHDEKLFECNHCQMVCFFLL